MEGSLTFTVDVSICATTTSLECRKIRALLPVGLLANYINSMTKQKKNMNT